MGRESISAGHFHSYFPSLRTTRSACLHTFSTPSSTGRLVHAAVRRKNVSAIGYNGVSRKP
jgi:hypothetical protein